MIGIKRESVIVVVQGFFLQILSFSDFFCYNFFIFIFLSNRLGPHGQAAPSLMNLYRYPCLGLFFLTGLIPIEEA